MRNRLLVLLLLTLISGPAGADMFLVKTTEGPGFASPEDAGRVLEQGIIPMFDALAKLRAEGRILAGGLPAGSRTLFLIVDAPSHDEVDRMLRNLPAWGVFSWTVTPLQSIEGRAAMEREILAALKAGG